MKNSEYWKDRMVQIELNALQKGESYYKNLQEQYDKAIHSINNDITVWYERLAKNNEVNLVEAKKLLDKNELKEFKWTLQDYIKYGKENAMNGKWLKELENASTRYHINRLEAMQLQMKQHLEELSNEQNKGMTNCLSDVYEDTYYHTAFEIQKVLNVGSSFEKIDKRRIEKVLNTGWAENKNFSDRIWENKEKLVSTLNTALTQMIIRGEAPDKAIKEISSKMGVGRKQAGRLVMTESSMMASQGQKDCFNELDIQEFEIVAALDIDTCSTCGNLDGKHMAMKDYRIGETAPPFHPNCRCCTAPYFADDEGQRIARDEEGKSYYVDSNMKYTDWKKKIVDNSEKSDIIKKNENKRKKEDVQFIGRLDRSKIGEYGKKIVTDDVVLTDERKAHIFQDHSNDFKLIIDNIDRVVLNPSEVLEDMKNKDTVYFIDKLEKNNLNVVVRLNTTNSKEHPQNSIMTAWVIRDKNLKKLRERNKILYKKE